MEYQQRLLKHMVSNTKQLKYLATLLDEHNSDDKTVEKAITRMQSIVIGNDAIIAEIIEYDDSIDFDINFDIDDLDADF